MEYIFNRIPDSAKEPDPEEVEYAEPKNIPLEDVSLSDILK